MAVTEDIIGDRTFRTRVVADLQHNTDDCAQEPEVVGVLGLSIDITDVKARAQLEIDNTRLSLEEQAAKDSNRLKSQFLANVRFLFRIRALADLDRCLMSYERLQRYGHHVLRISKC
jgi:hypothetical protein